MPPTGVKKNSIKSEGVCSVCNKVCRLFSDGGIVYRHGPHVMPCAGSGRPPSSIVPSLHLGSSCAPALSQPEPSQGLSTRIDPTQTDGGARRLEFTHPTLFGPMLKHIPKAARPTCSAHLTSLLTKVTDNPGEVELWSDLLSFGSRVLYKPTRGGRRHNLANAIKARCESNPVPAAHVNRSTRKHRDPDASLAAAVASKIEEGNLKAAIRLLSSDEKVAPCNQDTVTRLRAKHPVAPVTGWPTTRPVRLPPGHHFRKGCLRCPEIIPSWLFRWALWFASIPFGRYDQLQTIIFWSTKCNYRICKFAVGWCVSCGGAGGAVWG